MREAIKADIGKVEASKRLKQEALASWVAYQETGKHLTCREVCTWLSTWGTEDERAVPEAHT